MKQHLLPLMLALSAALPVPMLAVKSERKNNKNFTAEYSLPTDRRCNYASDLESENNTWRTWNQNNSYACDSDSKQEDDEQADPSPKVIFRWYSLDDDNSDSDPEQENSKDFTAEYSLPTDRHCNYASDLELENNTWRAWNQNNSYVCDSDSKQENDEQADSSPEVIFRRYSLDDDNSDSDSEREDKTLCDFDSDSEQEDNPQVDSMIFRYAQDDDPMPPLETLEPEDNLEKPTIIEESLDKFSAYFNNLLVYLYPKTDTKTLQNKFASLFEENLSWILENKGPITHKDALVVYDTLKELLLDINPDEQSLPADSLLYTRDTPISTQKFGRYQCNMHDTNLTDFTISPEGRVISTRVQAQYDKQYRLIGYASEICLNEGAQRTVVLNDDEPITSCNDYCPEKSALTHSPSGDDVAFAHNYRDYAKLFICNTKTGVIKEIADANGVSLRSLSFSPNGRYLFGNAQSQYDDKLISHIVWNVETGKQIKDPATVGYFVPSKDEIGLHPFIAFSADTEMMALARMPYRANCPTTISVFDHITGKKISSVELSLYPLSIEFSPDKSKLVVAGFSDMGSKREPVLKVLHLNGNKLIPTTIDLRGMNAQRIHKAVFSPDGKEIIYSGTIKNDFWRKGKDGRHLFSIFGTVPTPQKSKTKQSY